METISHQYSEDNITWFDCTKSDSEGYAELGYIIRPKPVVDVVENKKTVEDETLKILWCKAGDMNYPNFKKWYEANWQQSQSIEGIVGFVLECMAKRAEKSVPVGTNGILKQSVQLSRNQILEMRSDIVNQLNTKKK